MRRSGLLMIALMMQLVPVLALGSGRFVRTSGSQPVVRDNTTGLIWQGCEAGLSGDSCTGTSEEMTWEAALDYCDSLEWAGMSDWYLPGPKELRSSFGRFRPRQTGLAGRQLWNPPIRARILMAGHLAHRRDPWPHHPVPLRNPSPDGKGVLRFVCAASSNEAPQLLALDQVRLDAPPPTENGWYEFEEKPLPTASGGLQAWLPKYGSFTWSGWGALRLKSPAGGRAACVPAAALCQGAYVP